jgi:hypothetical protein
MRLTLSRNYGLLHSTGAYKGKNEHCKTFAFSMMV